MKKLSGWLLLSACVALTGCPGGGNDGGMGGGGSVGGGSVGGGGGSTGGGGGSTGGGVGGGGGGGMDAGVPLSQYCDQLAQKYCARETQCGFLNAAQQTACEGVVKQYCNPLIDEVNKGRRAYDASKVAGCFAAIAADDCRSGRDIDSAGYLYTYSACGLVTGKGAAAIGHSCTSDSDCAAGYCPSLNGACQVCAPFVAIGQPCDFDNPCDPTAAFCNDANVCQALVTQGNGPCTSFPHACAPGSYCTPGLSDGGTDDGGMRVCAAQLADGQPCSSSSDCTNGFCNDNSQVPDAGPDVCGVNPVGGPCYFSADCVTGASCDYNTDICVAKQTNLPANSPCNTSIDCQIDLWCGSNPDGGDDFCQPRVATGQMCATDSNCQAGNECDFDTSLCEAIAGPGGPCIDAANGGSATSDMCSETLFCDENADGGTCTGWLAVGADCGQSSNAVCSDGNGGAGLCNSTPDGGLVCGSYGATGDVCTDNFSCQSGRCLQADGGYLDGNNPTGNCAAACP